MIMRRDNNPHTGIGIDATNNLEFKPEIVRE